MLFFWGIRTTENVTPVGQKQCYNCNQIAQMERVVETRLMHFFWFLTVPINQREFIRCKNCNAMLDQQGLPTKVKWGPGQAPAWLRLFFLAVLAIPISAVLTAVMLAIILPIDVYQSNVGAVMLAGFFVGLGVTYFCGKKLNIISDVESIFTI